MCDWLNKEGFLTVRGRTFRGTHVHSTLEIKGTYRIPVWSDFSMEVVDKTILMSYFGVYSIDQSVTVPLNNIDHLIEHIGDKTERAIHSGLFLI